MQTACSEIEDALRAIRLIILVRKWSIRGEGSKRRKLVGSELNAQDCTSFEADDEIVRRDDLK